MKLAVDEEEYESSLEAELRSKLELTRIVRSGRTAKEPAVIRSLAEGIYVSKERCRRSFVKSVEEVEYFTDQVNTETFSKPDSARQTHIN